MTSESFFADPRFSQECHVPADKIRGRSEPLKITYADFGYRNEIDPEEENVLLFFPPLLGSRWMHTAKDDFAKKYKVRMITIERPGYGGTDEVAIQDRLQVWQDAIPAVLTHLNIKHVSVGCHSAGTVYALDFVLHHPEFLHPERPYLAIAGPWIPPSQSGVIGMRAVQSLPAAMIGKTDGFLRFMHSTVNPAIGAGTGAVSSLLSLVSRTTTSTSDADATARETDAEKEMRMRPDLLKKAYRGTLQGMGSDAVLMMNKVPDANTGGFAAGWGDWGGDYEAYVPRLVEALRAAKLKLQVHAFHAETDSMVGDYGDAGSVWFDGCWAKERCGDGVITYESSCVDDADHDLVWSIKFGVAGKVFGQIGQKEEKVPVEEPAKVEEGTPVTELPN